MGSHELKTKLRVYSGKLIAQYGRNNKLPATIIGAEYKGIRKVDKSGPPPTPIDEFLKRQLEKIAPLGDFGIKYRVGCCCEVRASNQILLIVNIPPSLRKIEFTRAIRPRTNQVINRCENCKRIFG